MAWIQKYADNFNRADENPIAAPWATIAGGRGRIVGQSYANVAGGGDAAYYNGALADNQRVQAVAKYATSLPASPAALALYVRYSAGGQVRCHSQNGNFLIQRNGVTQGAAVAGFYSLNDVCIFEYLNDVATLYINGVAKISRAIAPVPSGSVGLLTESVPGGTQAWDDFVAYEWVAAYHFQTQIVY